MQLIFRFLVTDDDGCSRADATACLIYNKK